MFRIAPTPMTLHKADASVVHHNQAAAAFLDDATALRVMASERESFAMLVAAVARDGEQRAQLVHLTHQGGLVTARAVATRVDAVDDVRVLVAFDDVSAVEAAERERTAMLERTATALRLEGLGRLAGGIAHDFNNVLAALQLQAELLRTTTEPDAQREIVGEMLAALGQGRTLAKRFLVFGRGAETEEVVLDRAVRHAEAVLRRLARPGVALEVQASSTGAQIAIDPAHLDQLLMNLVLNAQNATTSGTVRVRTGPLARSELRGREILPAPRGELVGLWVCDDGCGMSDDVLARAFEPFFTTSSGGAGTGVGLTVVHRAAQKAGAGIHVETAPGKGTTFLLSFRRVATSTSTSTPSPDVLMPRTPLAALPAADRPRILVVDDERTVRTALARTLERAGYSVLLAHDAASALATASHVDNIGLVITDFIMPGMTGAGFIEAARAQGCTWPVIVLSAYVGTATLPADVTVLAKPLEPELLLRAVQAHLPLTVTCAA